MLRARTYLLLVATFAMSLSATGTLIGYDIEQVLSTKIYSLMPSDRCSLDKLNTENITYGGLVLHAPEVDIDFSFCMYRASYVWKIAHSARLDDATFIAEESRLIPTYYPIETWTCRAIWTNQELHYQDFPIPNLSWKKKISLSMVEN